MTASTDSRRARAHRTAVASVVIGALCAAVTVAQIVAGNMHPLWLVLHATTVVMGLVNLEQTAGEQTVD